VQGGAQKGKIKLYNRKEGETAGKRGKQRNKTKEGFE